MEKMNGESLDIVADNIAKLKQIFPEVFNQDKVDFEKLEQVLGEYKDTDDERYSFTWPGKAQAIRIAQTPSTGTLRPCKEDSKNWDDTENLYIEGDNLEALKLLQKSYYGKVKMVYIDPPYNTGKDFIYPDDFQDNINNYLHVTGQVDEEGNKISANTEMNGRYHTNWLNMIYPRLKLSKSLLKEDGVIFISIDDKEIDNLKKICNEIFGEENLIGTLILQTATDNNPRQINTEHEYIVCYGKNAKKLEHWFAESDKAKSIQEKYLEIKNKGMAIEDIQIELRKWIKANKDNLEGVTHYDNVDEKGVFHDGDIANTVFGGYEYDVIHPITKRICKIPDKGFRYPEETLKIMMANNDIMFGKDETTLIKPKKRIETAKDVLRSVIYEDGRSSTKQFESLMARDIFQNPKSTTILERLIRFVVKENDIIVDFFSGSGTTAEAVMKFNANSKLNIKFILVQLPEDLDKMLLQADAKAKKTIKNAIAFLDTINKQHKITEIGKERIRRSGVQIKNEINTYKDEGKLDIGFKVFKLDSSNIKAWDPSQNENIEEQLFNMVNNIKEDRSEEDILFEILLKYGVDLNAPIEEQMLADKKVYAIGFGVIIACLADNITLEVVEAIGKLKEDLDPGVCRVVFKDKGFASDAVKTNAVQILKRYDIHEVKSI